ncbi:Uncharacterised protein [Mycobacteroides abscessus subsp. abscessus]|nr:Uncharacterised protein [Mycobacteroides abscessus subsp. abscessus]
MRPRDTDVPGGTESALGAAQAGIGRTVPGEEDRELDRILQLAIDLGDAGEAVAGMASP